MSKSYKIDLTGKRFGRLEVISFFPNEKKNSYWRCKCDCGNIVIVRSDCLQIGYTKSCGCISKKHNASQTRLYNTWKNMKKRCYNPKDTEYKRYGGRGITVCNEWKNDFKAFQMWAKSNGYNDTLTIDRIDVNKGYHPDNCRFVDIKTQNRNKRDNVIVEYKGEKMCLTDAAEKSGIHRNTLFNRYQKGQRGERLFRPVETRKTK